jgi:hypothetical protein
MTWGILAAHGALPVADFQYQTVKWHSWRFDKDNIRNFAVLLYFILFYFVFILPIYLFIYFIYVFIVFVKTVLEVCIMWDGVVKPHTCMLLIFKLNDLFNIQAA